MVPAEYFVRGPEKIVVRRSGGSTAIPTAHSCPQSIRRMPLIDDLYGADLNIASILGLRNLSAFVGELFGAAVVRVSAGQFVRKPASGWIP